MNPFQFGLIGNKTALSIVFYSPVLLSLLVIGKAIGYLFNFIEISITSLDLDTRKQIFSNSSNSLSVLIFPIPSIIVIS